MGVRIWILLMVIASLVGCSTVDYIECEDGTAVTDFSLCPEYKEPKEAAPEPAPEEPVVEEPEEEVVEEEPEEKGTVKTLTTEAEDVKCYSHEDCGDGSLLSSNCQHGTVVKTYALGECVNPGDKNSFCRKAKESEVIIDCGGTQACQFGECVVKRNCLDEDGGKNFDEMSKAIDDDTSGEDYCKNDRILVEYYCNEDTKTVESVEEECALGCKYSVCR